MTSKRVLQRGGLSVAVLLAAATFLVALPLLAFAAVALRVVLLVVLAALVVAGGIAYASSAAFRERVRAMFGTNLLHRGLRLSGDVDLDQAHTWTRFNTEEAIVGADDLVPAVLGPADRIDLPVAGAACSAVSRSFACTVEHAPSRSRHRSTAS